MSLPSDSVVVTTLLTVLGMVENEFNVVVSWIVEVDCICVIESVVVIIILIQFHCGWRSHVCVVVMDELVSVVVTIVSVAVCSIVIGL